MPKKKAKQTKEAEPANKIQTTGGMTTLSGESVLVTPDGTVVGSASVPSGETSTSVTGSTNETQKIAEAQTKDKEKEGSKVQQLQDAEIEDAKIRARLQRQQTGSGFTGLATPLDTSQSVAAQAFNEAEGLQPFLRETGAIEGENIFTQGRTPLEAGRGEPNLLINALTGVGTGVLLDAGFSQQDVLKMNSRVAGMSPEKAQAYLTEQVKVNVLKSHSKAVKNMQKNTLGQIADFIGLDKIGGGIGGIISNLVKSPSEDAQQIVNTLSTTVKEDIGKIGTDSKYAPRDALRALQQTEDEINRMEAHLQILMTISPSLRANPENVNDLLSEMNSVRLEINVAKREAAINLVAETTGADEDTAISMLNHLENR